MPPSDHRYDAIVIGGGHNGLVAAGVLARAGRRVCLVEAGETLGGAAQTSEFAPGFSVSSCAHILSHLHPAVAKALDLERHGLKLAAADIATVALDHTGRHLHLTGGDVKGVAPEDQAAWRALYDKLMRFAGVLKPWLANVPPGLDLKDPRNLAALGGLGLAVRRLGRADMREFLRLVLMNIADVLDDEIADDHLKGTIGFDAVLLTHMGPRSPGSVMSYYYRLAGGPPGLPKGGMGAVTEVLASSARAAGVEIRTGAAVERIVMKDDRTSGVILDTGEEIAASCVVSAANPRLTFLDLLGARHLDTGFVRQLTNIRMRGNAAKLHLALDGLPEIAGADLSGRLVIAPSLDYVERAFNPSKYGAFSEAPALEIVVPSLTDPSLAPPGKHVMSVVAAYAPYDLKGGWTDANRDAFKARILDTLDAHMPGLSTRILAAELVTPADMEARYRMPGGHAHHGELAVDQMLMLRPLPGAAQYATPVPGLYLAGAGSHPGGMVMGTAGLNAAHQVLKLERGA